jgi:hypothetical protein
VFIDGAHLFDYAMCDFLVSDRLIGIGGLIAFDDVDWPAVSQVVRFVLANRHYEVAYPDVVIEPLPGSPGLPSRVFRAAARSIPALTRLVRPEFLATVKDLDIDGRFAVLRKLAGDDRDSQAPSHVPF